MSKNSMPDENLNQLLGCYRVSVDTGEAAIDTLVRAARMRAASLRADMESEGFFGAIAAALGFHGLRPALWSGIGLASLMLVTGLSLGATHTIPHFDRNAVALDLDAAMGESTLTTGTMLASEEGGTL
jgi:hypothetical protein